MLLDTSLESQTVTLALPGMANIVGPDEFTGDLFFLACAARITLKIQGVFLIEESPGQP